MDEIFNLEVVRDMIYDEEDQMYYMLANKYDGKLGQFVVRFDEDDPKKFQFLLRVKNKLDIGDSSIYVHRNPQKKTKELIIGFKTIYLNTYTILVFDISNLVDADRQKLIF